MIEGVDRMFWALAQREKDIEKGRQEGRKEGRQEGREKGRQEGRAELIRELVAQSVNLPPEILKELESLPKESP